MPPLRPLALLPLILGSLSVGCTRNVERISSVPYTLSPQSSAPGGPLHDPIFESFGIPALSGVTLPPDCEEIRLNTGHGPGRGLAYPALRTARCQGRVTGEMVSFRTTYDQPCPWPHLGNYCVGRAAFTSRPDWAGFWHLVDSLDIWDLPSFADARRGQPDTWDAFDAPQLEIQWRRGAELRQWSYNDLGERPWPAAKRASAVLSAFYALTKKVELTPNNLIRQYPP